MELEPLIVESIARRAVDDPSASLLSWQAEHLGAGASKELGKSGGLLQVRGDVATAAGLKPWSAIGKTLRHAEIDIEGYRPDVEDPHGIEYWRREADAYASGTLDDLGDGLAAARVYRIDEQGDEVVIWMEEVEAEDERAWPIDRYWIAAKHLGSFNGRFAARVPATARPWASRGRLVDWVRDAADGVALMQGDRQMEFLQTWLGDRSAKRIGRLYQMRTEMLRLLEPLPETLCHHDAHRRNLISVRDGAHQRTIAVDWAMAGTGRLGEDLAVLTGVSLQFLDVAMSDHVEFEAAVIDGYVTGLRAAGWTGSEATLRSGYKAALSLFMGVAAAGVWYSGLSAQGDVGFAETVIGHPAGDIAGQWAEMQPYLLDLGEEALLAAV